VRYEHDRVLCTLAALVPVAAFGRRAEDRACVAAGTRYLWQHGHRLASEPIEPVAFELLLPTLVQRAQRAGVLVPPHLDIYAAQRGEKLRLIPAEALYSPRVTIVHSLEFLGDQADLAGLQRAQGANGALGNSPAATAFFFSHRHDPQAQAYLEDCLARSGGAMAPVLHPCETFELLWAAYHFFLAGVPAARLLGPAERVGLRSALQAGGVSLSPTFPIPDADDTAVALLLLHDLGEPVDPDVLQAFALPDGHFASFPHERHSSVGVNLHVLHALLHIPGYPDRTRTIDRLLNYLAGQQSHGLYWFDKWHISPYYATAHALCILAELPAELAARMEPLVERSREWLRQTQNSDGSWGFYGQPTAEETAYAVLALTAGDPAQVNQRDRQCCAAAACYLRALAETNTPGADQMVPPLWIDKCLYTPTLVVRAVIESALMAYKHTGMSNHEP
jgi:halimadienyl-diphosphate synthase